MSSFIFWAGWPFPFSVGAVAEVDSAWVSLAWSFSSSLTSDATGTAGTATASPFSAFARLRELESEACSGEDPRSRLTEAALVAVTGGEVSVSAIVVILREYIVVARVYCRIGGNRQ